MKMESEAIVHWLRDKAARAEGLDYRRTLNAAAVKIGELEELLSERKEPAGGNRISYEERKKTYLNALIGFGQTAQSVVAIEELSECQKEICKFLRGGGDRLHLAEEIADSTIMLEQLRIMYGVNEDVCRIMDEKVERLDRKLRGDNGA